MKKLLSIISAVCLCAVVFLGGCISGKDGVDGKDGEDVSIYDIYNAVNEEREEAGLSSLSFLEFVSEYLSYDGSELEETTSLKSAINRSLMSSVSILSSFSYTMRSNSMNGITTTTYNEIYTGSGVIIDVDKDAGSAYIVTNCHVIYSSSSDEEFCEDLHVYLYGKDDYTITPTTVNSYYGYYTYEIDDGDWGMPATVVSASITYDLALLKVEDSDTIRNSDVYAAKFADDDILEVGETVYAIGNAEGEGIAATTGIISKDSEYIDLALDDNGNDSRSYRVLRTDAAINSGNSGGGLFNSAGEIVGIVNAKEASEDVDNMGYALPVGTVKRVIANMLDYEGTVAADEGIYKGLLGVTVTTDKVGSGIDSSGTAYITEAAVIYSIEVNSMAYGYLQENDIITHVKITGTDGTVREDLDITRVYLLIESMISVRADDTVTVTVKRNGEYKDYSFVFTKEELTKVD